MPHTILIQPGHELADAFRARGCRTFSDAIEYVAELPYGRTTDRADYRQVLSEGRGTCSTRHAVVAALGAHLGLPVQLYIGMYAMTGASTPGVGPVLEHHGLTALPEAHTFMRYAGERLDITRPGVQSTERVTTYLDEVAIAPDQIGAFKVAYHQKFMHRWLDEHPEVSMSFEDLWAVREACIRAIAEAQALIPVIVMIHQEDE